MSHDLDKAIDALDDLDCGDRACLFAWRKSGRRTDEGCRCLLSPKPDTISKIAALLRAARDFRNEMAAIEAEDKNKVLTDRETLFTWHLSLDEISGEEDEKKRNRLYEEFERDVRKDFEEGDPVGLILLADVHIEMNRFQAAQEALKTAWGLLEDLDTHLEVELVAREATVRARSEKQPN